VKQPIDQATLLQIALTTAVQLGSDFKVVIDGRRGHSGVVYARQVAQFLCRERGASYHQIAALFGNCNHVSVISNCRRLSGLMDVYPEIHSQVEGLRKKTRS
jgi:chromosomal replication initiation ATPase DnaA